MRPKKAKAGAAPATVSGEPLSNKVTETTIGFGKAGQQHRPASQETCLDNINVLGRGVPVVRLRFRAPFVAPESRRVTLAFAPKHLG